VAACATAFVAISSIVGCGTIEPDSSDESVDMTAFAALTDISDPVDGPSATPGASTAGVGSSVAYVSVEPGSFEFGTAVTVRNGDGDDQLLPIVDGGFDPVAIVAGPGDILFFSLRDGASERGTWSEPVPLFSPPVIVRSSPARGKRDVPVALSLFVLFSEPMDETTLDPTTVRLTRGGEAVAGHIEMSSDLLSLMFTPDADLDGEAMYVLTIGRESSDLDGEMLGTDQLIEFTTDRPPSPVAGLYTRVTPWAYDGGAPRFVLEADYTFRLRLPGLFNGVTDLTGRYVVDRSGIDFQFDGFATWRAAATVTGDSLVVQYNSAMEAASVNLDGWRSAVFEDGAHVRDGAPQPPLPSVSGRVAFEAYVVGSTRPHIHVANADGSGSRVLTMGLDAAWSPDGGRLTFTRWKWEVGDTSGIFIIDADGTDEVLLRTGAGQATWSPDGQRIAFVDAVGVQVMDLNGNVVATVLDYFSVFENENGMGGIADLAWSPDGQQIVFTRTGDGDMRGNQAFVVNADGSGLRELVAENCARDRPAWSPDGSEIAFMGCGYIAIVSSDGTNYRSLTWGYSPTWSPDGQRLLVGGAEGWFLVDRQGSVRRLLIPIGSRVPSGSIAWTVH